MNHFEPALNRASGTPVVPHECNRAVNLKATRFLPYNMGTPFLICCLPNPPVHQRGYGLVPGWPQRLYVLAGLDCFHSKWKFSIESPYLSVFLLFSLFVLRRQAFGSCIKFFCLVLYLFLSLFFSRYLLHIPTHTHPVIM